MLSAGALTAVSDCPGYRLRPCRRVGLGWLRWSGSARSAGAGWCGAEPVVVVERERAAVCDSGRCELCGPGLVHAPSVSPVRPSRSCGERGQAPHPVHAVVAATLARVGCTVANPVVPNHDRTTGARNPLTHRPGWVPDSTPSWERSADVPPWSASSTRPEGASLSGSGAGRPVLFVSCF